ncbi:hypothetical protein NMG60_11025709 [Bertholletia excelsa]
MMMFPSAECLPDNQDRLLANKLLSNCLLLSSSSPFVLHTPLLFRQPPSSKLNLQAQVASAARQLHSSVVSTAQGFLTFLRSLSSKLHSLHSQDHQRIYTSFNSWSNHNFAAILPGDSVAGVVVANGLLNFLNIYNTLLVVRLVLTWFPNSPPAIVSPLSTLCDPYLNIFRGIIPPLGGTLDLSPILAFLVLNAFTSTAAALPAELPKTGMSQEFPTSYPTASSLSTSQHKWMTRLSGSRKKNLRNVN